MHISSIFFQIIHIQIVSPGRAGWRVVFPFLWVNSCADLFVWESEQPYHGATQLLFMSFFLLCAVFLCFHTIGCEAYSFMTGGYGREKNLMHTNLGACHIHRKAQTSLHKSWLKGWKNYPSPCPSTSRGLIESKVFRFECWCTNYWAMSPTDKLINNNIQYCPQPWQWRTTIDKQQHLILSTATMVNNCIW